MKNEQSVRPTKKQHQTLEFIGAFIKEHGYSPSYREIMNGCNYTSVATVALHVKSLIDRGHIRKRDKSARSLEVVGTTDQDSQGPKNAKPELAREVESRLKALEKEVVDSVTDEVRVLINALTITGHEKLAQEYVARLDTIS
mgnify:CR=1 FL=1